MTVLKKGLILLAPGLLLAGCTMAPRYERPALPVPAAPTGAPQADETPPLAWNDFFTDARLRQVITLALANNRDLRIAMAHVAEARARAHVQGADLFPTITAGAGGTIERVPPGLAGVTSQVSGTGSRYDIYQAQVGVSAWEVDLFGRVRSLTQAAQDQYFASAANRRAAQVTLVSEVATAWLQLVADREQLRIARETADSFEQTLKITQARATMGVSSDLDIHQAETSYQQARSDVQAAEFQLKAANANIGAARAAFFPNISLTAAFGTLSLGLSNLFGTGSQTWSVAPTVSVPIFDAGRNIANLREAKATQDEMVATYEKAIQTAFREVADALARRATISDQLGAQEKRAYAAQGALKISRARYEEGVDPFLTTLDSQRSYYTARQDLVTTRLTRQTNAVELYRALGGGLSDGDARASGA